jgi:hypothetical protein
VARKASVKHNWQQYGNSFLSLVALASALTYYLAIDVTGINIIIIIIIIIILGTSFMQGICTYIPSTNHDLKEHHVAAILVLLFMVLISLVPVLTPLHLYASTFQSMCAVPNVAVFCSSLTYWYVAHVFSEWLK